ncbi:hypothetical protein D9758_001626 [Tetrapyrgos nigripes]|uniref:Tr-type G domain-containing protein n=1 Tax=Tetrapyrgos nigripes TaxID=182062 RepID=A0A8H5LXD1_9AGAR|nr:hypothetical protein D9758_001626 [Tetrapyrgos nigripes]
MHRHRKSLQCAFSRSASTAVKLQPRSWAKPADTHPTPSASVYSAQSHSKLAGTNWDTPSRFPSNAPSYPPSSVTRAPSSRQQRTWDLDQASEFRRPAVDSPPSSSEQRPTFSRTRTETLRRDPLPHRNFTPRERPYSQPRREVPGRQRDPMSHAGPSGLSRSSQLGETASAQAAPPKNVQGVEDTGASLEEDDSDLHSRKSRAYKATKGRGSLVERMQFMPEESSTQQHSHPAIKKRARKIGRFVEKKVTKDVYIPSVVSVGQLAQLLDVRLEYLQRRMKRAGMEEEATYDHVLTSDYAVLLAEELDRNPIVNDEMAFDIYPPPPHPDPSSLPLRPPVVTIMGHVDHGKTTLLDTLRSASVAKGEADTPGHAAFSAMRARGAGVTDIIVLVVAADDGIMPQTREVIELIKKDRDNVGVVVAINKVDKPGVDIDAVKKSLLAEDIQLEDFGGDVPSVEVSGLTGHGLPNLVETLSAIAEMQELRAEQDGPVHGYVLESKVVKGLGPVATVLILRGSLKPGSHIVAGVNSAKVRIMNDSFGKSINAANPGAAVTVSGWKTLPNAGDEVLQGSESDVKKAVANRQRKAELDASLADVEAINAIRRQERERRELELLEEEQGKDGQGDSTEESSGPKELRLVIKADVSGSAEAVVDALQGIGNSIATTKVVSSGVGDVTESDIAMAKTGDGLMIIAFSVKVPKSIERLAEQNNVRICSSNIIYRLIDTVKEHVIKLLPVIIEKKVTGEASVFNFSTFRSGGRKSRRWQDAE